jgi:spermidine synthase
MFSISYKDSILRSSLLLIIFGISGMTALIYEITWIRPLSLVFGTTLYSVTTIVASFILGLGLGSWIMGKYTDRMKNTLQYFAITQVFIGIYGIFLLLVFPHLPDFYSNLYHVTPNYELFLTLQVMFSILLLIIPTTLMGSTLPLLFKAYTKNIGKIGESVGKLDGSNSFGAMIGVLCAGFIMIPVLGIHLTVIITAIINFTIGFGVLFGQRKIKKIFVVPIIVAVVLVLFVFPSYNVDVMNSAVFIVKPSYSLLEFHEENKAYSKTLYYDESQYASILVQDHGEYINLKINGKIQCSDEPSSVQGLKNLANLPSDLFVGNPNSALNIGLGCGTTAAELSKNIPTTTIEIDPSIVKASEIFYQDTPHTLIIDDARNWLLRNSETFDIIITEPTDLYVNDVNVLYTKEFFQILHDSVSEKGLVAQWIPVYELTNTDFHIMYNTFHSVFPYVYGYQMELGSDQQIILVGSKFALENYENELFLFDHSTIKEMKTELNTDDKPIIEFRVSKNLFAVGSSDSVLGKIKIGN